GTVMNGLTDNALSFPARAVLVNSAVEMAAIQAAGYVCNVLAVFLVDITWPLRALPIAAAVIAYCLVKSTAVEIVIPLCTKQPFNRSWPIVFIHGSSTYFIGASVAAIAVEVIDHQAWQILPVISFPLFLAYRAHTSHVSRLNEDDRRREVLDAVEQGMAVVDARACVTLWNDAIERILGTPRSHALGRSIALAVPALVKSELPRAVEDVLLSRNPR